MRFAAIILLFTLFSCKPLTEDRGKVRNGVADLRLSEIDADYLISLNGTWEFYWNKFLRPVDFTTDLIQVPDLYGKVPSYWTLYKNGDDPIPQFGYATYRARILLPSEFDSELGLIVPVFDSSFELFVDGKYAGGNGNTGRTKPTTVPGYKPFVYTFRPDKDSVDIIINVANFHHRRGGFWVNMQFGSSEAASRRSNIRSVFAMANASILLAFSVFFMIFYLMSFRNIKMLWFSLSLLGFALRLVFTSPFLIFYFTELSWEWVIRLEYITFFLSIGAGTLFLNEILRFRFMKYLAYLIGSLGLISTIFVLLTKTVVFSHLMIVWYPAIITVMVSGLVLNLIEVVRKKGIYYFHFLAMMALFSGGIHDLIMSALGISTTAQYVLPSMIILFVFLQTGIIINEWIRNFFEKEQLGRELKFVNENLEKIVGARTKELKSQKAETERRGKMVNEKNRELNETIDLKNKVFSVIAHDLRSPLVSILYMLNLLKDEKDEEKAKEMVNSGIRYGQTLILLLENMLVWGRGQENRLIFSPARTTIPELVLNNLSLLKEETKRKEINTVFSHKGKGIAMCDRDLVDIIIRNILSNAVKFTPVKGIIEVSLHDSRIKPGYLEIIVSDSGIGMDSELVGRLFDDKPLDSTPGTEGEKGTGLGLKLAYQLTKINKGDIAVESSPGNGSRFILYLPKD